MGTIYLGLPGPWAKSNRELSDHYTSKIGGIPDWPSKELDITPDLLTCRVCEKSLCLVAQIYAPLSLNGMDLEERNLYVFGCSMETCASISLSWRAIRIQRQHMRKNIGGDFLGSPQVTDSIVSTPSRLLAEDLWAFEDEKLNGDNEDDMDFEELSRALSEATTAASKCKKEINTMQSKQPQRDSKIKGSATDLSLPALPCFYMYSQEECRPDALNDTCATYSTLSLKENQSYSVEVSDEEKWEGEVYEYDRALQADRTYLKFKKRVDSCPEQCFRYSFGGQPLLAESNAGDPGTCSLCGAVRHYEMQLMPALLHFLPQATDSSSASSKGWDWMTLIIYTCSNSCSHQSGSWIVAEEAVVVQDESGAGCHGSNTIPKDTH